MKIKVTMKDPDVMFDAVQEAVEAELLKIELPEDEKERLIEIRSEKERKKLGEWFRYGEYLTVEFDTETMIATVCNNG